MVHITDMRRSIKGFYTLEAAVFLPFVILAILSLGYFIKIEGLWENCIHGAIDESSVIASKSYSPVETMMIEEKIKNRVTEDNKELDTIEVDNIRIMHSDFHNDSLISYEMKASEYVEFPLIFKKEFTMTIKVKFRGFVGRKTDGSPLGASGLENSQAQQPVWIFPQSGKKFHKENCTYIKASVSPVILTSSVKNKYDPCGICKSEDLNSGSMVFCFKSDGTSYHRGVCRSIKRRCVKIDKTEAEKKGYRKCSKCGG